jgi:uncharacterized membrane protein
MSSWYPVLVFAHILSATIWVGGGIMAFFTARQVEASGDESAKRVFTSIDAWTGSRLFGPAAFAVVLFGALMVWQNPAWSLGQLWVWLSLTLALLSMVLGGAVLGPQSARAAQLAAERGADDPEVQRIQARMRVIENFDLLAVIVIVGLMVFKPGA